MEPTSIKKRSKLDRRLGIKSSMPKPQSAFAALYIIWKGAGEPDSIDYCHTDYDNQETLKISDELYEKVSTYWGSISDNVPENFREEIENSPLFSSQLEHLQVLFTLFWKVAKVSFIDDYPGSKERTGGKRFLKKLEFTTNLDLLNLTLTPTDTTNLESTVFDLLMSWLRDENVPDPISDKLKKHLTILSEDTWLRHAGNTFLQEGIYNSLEINVEPINFDGETKGPLRILNSTIIKGLHTVLQKTTAGIIFKDGVDSEYIKRVSNFLDIQEVNSDAVENTTGNTNTLESNTELPLNLILYGAPGTGKSYKLKKRISKLNPEEYQRITFYSDYSYSQFVGGYKPIPVYVQKDDDNFIIKDKSDTDLNRPGQPLIEYSFVAGPLLRLYVNAKNNPDKKYLLIIEELNRADAAAVFGEFFQLLDRKTDGTSEYETQLSKEANDYLTEQGIDDDSVSLPSNLFIWSTLNSADQGVFPIDTAFKRRWEFEYLPLNENEHVVSECYLTLETLHPDTGEKIDILWNDLRNKINLSLSDIGIQEDLMIGPFFLTAQEMQSSSAFKYKLISYLRDDILRHQYHDFFSVEGTLDHIIKVYDEGKNIFNFEIH